MFLLWTICTVHATSEKWLGLHQKKASFRYFWKKNSFWVQYFSECSFLAPTVCPKLSEIDRQSCDGEISKEGCELALRGMMNNKAPSVYGFSKEFFLNFWLELGDIVVNYINQAREQGVFIVTQRRGVLTLIPKKGDPKLIQNKRPICLLDVIYKIVAKVLANRMMSVIHTIICPDQTGSIRGRYIGTNLRTIADVIYYASADRLDGIVMALDFRNAFNSVEHEFVYNVLKEFNFGENFIGWTRLLHNSNELTVINNGFTSSWYQTGRGLQQGCPASGLTFALVLEILSLKIRDEEEVRGISVSGETFKSTQYCDDMTLFLRDSASADKAISLVKKYGYLSGLELNMRKCEFMLIGAKKGCELPICGKPPAEKMKILGVWYSVTHNCADLNFEALEARVSATLQQWSQRSLTIKGKITVAKSLIVSQMVNIMATTRVDEKHLALIQSHIMSSFLWRGRPPKVAKSTITMPIEKGGLNAPDLHLMNRAYRISWLGKLVKLKETLFVNLRPAGGGGVFEHPPCGFSRIARKRRRAAPPGFHLPYPPSFWQLLWKFRSWVMQGQVTRSGQVTIPYKKFTIAPQLQCLRESYETFGIW